MKAPFLVPLYICSLLTMISPSESTVPSSPIYLFTTYHDFLQWKHHSWFPYISVHYLPWFPPMKAPFLVPLYICSLLTMISPSESTVPSSPIYLFTTYHDFLQWKHHSWFPYISVHYLPWFPPVKAPFLVPLYICSLLTMISSNESTIPGSLIYLFTTYHDFLQWKHHSWFPYISVHYLPWFPPVKAPFLVPLYRSVHYLPWFPPMKAPFLVPLYICSLLTMISPSESTIPGSLIYLFTTYHGALVRALDSWSQGCGY